MYSNFVLIINRLSNIIFLVNPFVKNDETIKVSKEINHTSYHTNSGLFTKYADIE